MSVKQSVATILVQCTQTGEVKVQIIHPMGPNLERVGTLTSLSKAPVTSVTQATRSENKMCTYTEPSGNNRHL